MSDIDSISHRVLDTLVSAGLVTGEQLALCEEKASSGDKNAGQVLVERGLVTPADLQVALEEEMGIPQVDLSSYAPDDSALSLVPAGTAKARRILPLFEIEGMLTVAVGNPVDVFSLDALATELGVEVEPVLADGASVLEAIAQYYGEADGAEETPSPAPFVEETAEHGAPISGEATSAIADVVAEPVTTADAGPSIDLDVLAVADAGKVAVLVSDILESAVRRGAARIHLLPYKDDFFLVYRLHGRLEKVASAALGMQKALVDGFKSYSGLGGTPPTQPALGRMRTRVAEKDLVLTVSVVPTVAGQRLVVNIAPYRAQPHTLPELGLGDAETKALHAMIERGRGVLLVCAPINGGAAETYYSLLAHAASAGKTAYSVERNVEYEIPAVAQVMVVPGSPIGPAAYLAAGIRQDTDVVAIEGMSTADEAHLLMEAVGLGKLAIASVPAGDVASGIARLLGAGVEATGLASALTMVVGQRMVRTNCPNCSVEERNAAAGRLPGAPEGLVSKAGSGCPNCAKTGFAGVTGIFEILLMNDAMRTTVSARGSVEAMRAGAEGAGMRPLAASGLAKVEAGLVSVEELDRVLRFSDA